MHMRRDRLIDQWELHVTRPIVTADPRMGDLLFALVDYPLSTFQLLGGYPLIDL